jgi:hypothetical protein
MWIHRDEAVPPPPSRDSGPPILAMKPLISARFDQRLLHRQRALVGMWIPLWKSTLEHLSAWTNTLHAAREMVIQTASTGWRDASTPGPPSQTARLGSLRPHSSGTLIVSSAGGAMRRWGPAVQVSCAVHVRRMCQAITRLLRRGLHRVRLEGPPTAFEGLAVQVARRLRLTGRNRVALLNRPSQSHGPDVSRESRYRVDAPADWLDPVLLRSDDWRQLTRRVPDEAAVRRPKGAGRCRPPWTKRTPTS